MIDTEADKLAKWAHAIVMGTVYATLSKKKGAAWTKEQFKHFFSLTDEEVEVILKMWGTRRTINSGKKDGY